MRGRGGPCAAVCLQCRRHPGASGAGGDPPRTPGSRGAWGQRPSLPARNSWARAGPGTSGVRSASGHRGRRVAGARRGPGRLPRRLIKAARGRSCPQPSPPPARPAPGRSPEPRRGSNRAARAPPAGGRHSARPAGWRAGGVSLRRGPARPRSRLCSADGLPGLRPLCLRQLVLRSGPLCALPSVFILGLFVVSLSLSVLPASFSKCLSIHLA